MTLVAVFAFCGTVEAQEVSTVKQRLRLIRAFCTTGPCTPGITFSAGTALINRMKQPKPLAKRKIGKIRVKTVQSTPLPLALEAEVTARFIWDAVDPDGDCPDAGSDTAGVVLATSSMACNLQIDRASCGGDLLTPIGLIDPRCTDVRLTLHDINVAVYEFGNVGVDTSRVAVNGISVVGRSPDCSSGGAGCP